MANFIPKIVYTHPVDGVTTINFTLPPEGDPLKKKKQTTGRETRSNNGDTQYQLNYSDQTFKLNFIFLEKTTIDALEKMFDDHASIGEDFNYYPSDDESEFFNVLWPGARKVFAPVKVIRSGADFIYDLEIPLRVVI